MNSVVEDDTGTQKLELLPPVSTVDTIFAAIPHNTVIHVVGNEHFLLS